MVFQTAGPHPAVQNGLSGLSTNGVMICLGYLNPSDNGIDSVFFNRFIRNGQHLTGSFGYSQASFLLALNGLVTGRFQVSPLLTKTISLEAALEQGFDELSTHRDIPGKVLDYPSP